MMSKRAPGMRRRYDDNTSQRAALFHPPHDRSTSNTLTWRHASAMTPSCARMSASTLSSRSSRGKPGGGASAVSGALGKVAMAMPVGEHVDQLRRQRGALSRRQHAPIGELLQSRAAGCRQRRIVTVDVVTRIIVEQVGAAVEPDPLTGDPAAEFQVRAAGS